MKLFHTREPLVETNDQQGETWASRSSAMERVQVFFNRPANGHGVLPVEEHRGLVSFSKVSVGIALCLLMGSGCATMGHGTERYVACPYDQVWDSSLHAFKEYPLSEEDKEAGILETEWIETAVQNRPYGLFSREGLQEKQRFRTRAELTPYQEVTAIRISERREHWGFRGGAQIYKWFPVEPSKAALQHFLNNLVTPLEKQGCLIES